jgi:hypothetical protein
MKTLEIFYIGPDYDGGPLLDMAMFDGPGWCWWGGARSTSR